MVTNGEKNATQSYDVKLDTEVMKGGEKIIDIDDNAHLNIKQEIEKVVHISDSNIKTNTKLDDTVCVTALQGGMEQWTEYTNVLTRTLKMCIIVLLLLLLCARVTK